MTAKRVACLLALFLVAVPGADARAQDGWETSFDDCSPDAAQRIRAVQERLDDVSTLNLVNGLHLSIEQVDAIVALATEVRDLRERTMAEHAREIEELAQRLGVLQEHLVLASPEPPADLQSELQAREHRLQEVRQRYFEALVAIDRRLHDVLTDGQRAVIADFLPCLIPPRELRDPVRVGQAAGGTEEVRDLLEAARNVPERHFAAIADVFASMLIEHERAALHLDPAEEEGERTRVAALLRRARSMNDTEYALEADRLAQELVSPFHRVQETMRELGEVAERFGSGLSKAGKMLLNPRVIPLLLAKRRSLVEQGAGASSGPGLAGVDPAPLCGSCNPDGDGSANASGGAGAATEPAPHPGRKPRFEALAAWLRIAEEQRTPIRAAFARAQSEMLDLLLLPREDGVVMLREVFRAGQEGGEDGFMRLLSQRVPGSEESYLGVLFRIKDRAESELHARLTPEQLRQWRASGIDLFDVKVGRLDP